VSSQQHPGTTRRDSEIVTKASPWSVTVTVERFSEAITKRGLKLFAVIDHSGEAKAAGLRLRETKVVIFGSPRAGTPVMDAVALAALDLPLKALVWAEAEQTKVSYTSPAAFAERYGLSEELAAPLAGIEAITDAVISGA
jgi:uncharacterized protein (DUF302 family)